MPRPTIQIGRHAMPWNPPTAVVCGSGTAARGRNAAVATTSGASATSAAHERSSSAVARVVAAPRRPPKVHPPWKLGRIGRS